MIFTHEITLDTTFNEIKTINIKQYTKDSFLLHVNLTDRGEPFHANKTTHKCHFKMETPDKKHNIFTDGFINDDGTVDILIPEKACLAAGSGTAELIFVESEIASIANAINADANMHSDKSVTESAENSADSYGNHSEQGTVFATMNLNINIVASSYSNSHITSSDDFDALHSALLAANKTYDYVMTSANASANAAKESEVNALTSERNAKTSESNAAASALLAKSYAVGDTGLNNRENENEDCAKNYCENANKSKEASAASALLAKSYAVGDTGLNDRENENEDCAKNYCENACKARDAAASSASLAQSYAESFSGALRPMGTIPFAELPPIANASEGDMYNISDRFTTDSRFREGAGLAIPLGTNVYKTADDKWDILAGSPVAGVKGNAELSFHTGNVNITPANIGLGNVNNTADVDKNVFTAKRLKVEVDNYKQGTDLPSTYPQGEVIFFSNNPNNRFNGIQYCTIHTIKGYTNVACIQFLYPYNTNHDKFYFREALYNTDAWRDWREVITSANIGSQSVNYATSAGSATKAAQDGDGNVIKDNYAIRKVVTGGDFNDMVTPGLYTMRNVSANKPSSGTYYGLLVLKSDNGNYVEQIAFYESTNTIYIRHLSNTTWGEWIRILTEESYLNLSNKAIGILPVANGGTGNSNGKLPYNKLLWGGSGGAYMYAGQTASLSEPISSQPHGIVLEFAEYINSSITNSSARYSFFIPKMSVEKSPTHSFIMSTGNFATMCYKTVHITDSLISGSDMNRANGTGGSGIKYDNMKFVLQYVFGV